MTTAAVAVATGGIEEFKLGVDNLLAKKRYFVTTLMPTLVVGKDYFLIRGRRSLGKSGAEAIAQIFGLRASFRKDSEATEVFKNLDGVITLKCTLTKDGVFVAEGSAAAVLGEHNGCVNSTIKICEKRAFVSSIIRATGLSDLFSQDLEDLHEFTIKSHTAIEERPQHTDEASNADDHYQSYERTANEEEGGAEESPQDDPHAMTKKQRDFLLSLIAERISDREQTESWLARLDSGLSISDASELISSLIPAR